MNTKTITHLEIEPSLNWSELLTQLTEGHKLPKAKIKDTLITRRDDTLLSRVAWIDGLGQLVKTATIFPKNNKKKSIIKSISWRIVGTTTTFIITGAVLKNFYEAALFIALLELISKFILYYFHERFWLKIPFGYLNNNIKI